MKTGQVVAEFDTTEQEYKLKEAEADLAEAEAHLAQAKAQNDAQDEEDRYALLKAESDVRLAELDVRKNPLLPSLTAKENTLTLDAAKDHLTQLQHNLANRKATNQAAIAIQEAARGKAESQAKTARENIEAMTLKAHRDGYVSVRQNAGGNMMFYGMVLPIFQVGDQVRPGMAVAEIPDLKNWELSANIGELDRGHLSVGEPAEISVVALPNANLQGSRERTRRHHGFALGPAFRVQDRAGRSRARASSRYERNRCRDHRSDERRSVAALAGHVRKRRAHLRLCADPERVHIQRT